MNLQELKTPYPYLRVTDMKQETILFEKLQYATKSVREKIKNYTISSDDIYVTIAGTIGDSGTVPIELNGSLLTENALKLVLLPEVNQKFLVKAINSSVVQNQFESLFKQVAQSKLSIKSTNSTLVPLPPIAEQVRIMKQVDNLLTNVDLIEFEQQALQDLADQLKKTVLDVAMQGKLVPQDPNDEPASVLLEKIRAEKKKLYEEGKIKKKDLVETEIVKCEDNAYYEKIGKNFNKIDVPYQIPNTWKWSRLRDIVSLNIGGGTPSKNNRLYWDGDIPWASVKDIQSNTLSKTFELITDIGLSNSSANIVPKGNVVIATRMSLNKVAVTIIDTAINQDLRGLFFVTDELRDYFVRMYPHLKFPSLGTTVKGISLPVFNSTLVPLPNEQQLTKINLLVQEVDKYCLEFQ